MNPADCDETFDFVIVGSGGGSMCAALVMQALGKTSVILEKTGLVGGTTARSGGVMWIPGNRFMAEDGVADTFEEAMTYLDATVGQSRDAPGATRERRAAYLTEGPRMVDFLSEQGIMLGRVNYWPDYYDERPGGSKVGRTVVADLFDAGELPGDWAKRLRANFMQIPASIEEAFTLGTFKQSWKGKRMLAKVALRAVAAKLTGKRWVAAGAALQGRMLQAALRAGTDIRIDAGVSSFIVHDGAVTGVVTQKDGGEWRIGAQLGVLVNAGGFSQNQAMRDQYQPGTSVAWTGTAPGDTGEMIRAMIGLGAAVAQMEEMVGNQMSIPPGRENTGATDTPLDGISNQGDFAKPHSIIVDQSGVRYMNEGGSYMEFCKNMRERNQTVPAVPSWWVFDAQYARKYGVSGTFGGTKKPVEWYESGYLNRANTVEELAAMVNVPFAALKSTLDAWNADVRAGRDSRFHRGDRAYDKFLGDAAAPSPSCGTIEVGPFYAAPVVPGDVGTFGGVVTDVCARVLREDGSVIPRLYATGTSTASVMGRFYPGAGSSVGPSFVWGYVAAKHAACADSVAG